DDRDVGLKGGIAPDMPELIGGRVLRKIENHGPLPLPASTLDELADALDVSRAHHEIDPRGALQNLVTRDLGDAAGHAEEEARLVPLLLRENAQRAVDLCLRFLANGAGVQEDDVGGLGESGRTIAPGLELPGHPLAVEHVHLAAPRLDAVESRRVSTIHRL